MISVLSNRLKGEALQIQQSGILSLFEAGILTVLVGLLTTGCLPLDSGKASDRKFFKAVVLEIPLSEPKKKD
jgi:hypothetical protein